MNLFDFKTKLEKIVKLAEKRRNAIALSIALALPLVSASFAANNVDALSSDEVIEIVDPGVITMENGEVADFSGEVEEYKQLGVTIKFSEDIIKKIDEVVKTDLPDSEKVRMISDILSGKTKDETLTNAFVPDEEVVEIKDGSIQRPEGVVDDINVTGNYGNDELINHSIEHNYPSNSEPQENKPVEGVVNDSDLDKENLDGKLVDDKVLENTYDGDIITNSARLSK